MFGKKAFKAKTFKPKAFSLVELLIFMSLILIMVTVAIPRVDFLNKYLLAHDLDRLYSLFIFLQQKSIAANKKHTLFLDQVKNSATYFDENSVPHSEFLSDKISFGFIPGVMGPPAAPSKIIEKPVYLEKFINNSDRNCDSAVGFWPDGRVTPGTIYLVDRSHKCMGALTCSVSQVSYIRRYVCERFKWKSLEN